MPTLSFYFRPDVWRGNDGHTGVNNPDSFIVVACGLDEIRWDYDQECHANLDHGDWDKEVWCDVTPGPRIEDMRVPPDYYDLPADRYTTDAISMKRRRISCRDLLTNGGLAAQRAKGAVAFMNGRWPWLLAAGMGVIGFIALMMALG